MFSKLRKILGLSRQNMVVRTSSDYQHEIDTLAQRCASLEKARQDKQEEVWANMEMLGKASVRLDNALEDINNLLTQNRQLVTLGNKLTDQFKKLFEVFEEINDTYGQFNQLPDPQPLKSREELQEWKRDQELAQSLNEQDQTT